MPNTDFLDGEFGDYQWCLSEYKEIEVILDTELVNSIFANNPEIIFEENPHRIRINLFKLIIAIGSIKTRRFNPTPRQKFFDKCDLLDSIQNSLDFKIYSHEDAEIKKEISEEFGIGLSVLIADHFYNIQWSTLGKIPLTGGISKPDITCLTSESQEIVIEAKGTINKYTRNKQKKRSLEQKVQVPADICISSCSLLKSETISDVDFSDPPVISPNDKKYTELLLKADHYSRIFNFIGQQELSVYFNLMRKRIIHDTKFPEFSEKERLYTKIKHDYISISKFEKTFLGSIEKDSSGNFIFIGVDENLISLREFIEFRDYKIDSEMPENDNNFFYISSDGLCFAKLTDIRFLENQLKNRTIPHYQESTSMTDIDSMNKFSFVNYIVYLFKKLNCAVNKGSNFQDAKISTRRVPDLFVIYDNIKILVEVKKSLKFDNLNIINQLNNRAKKSQCEKSILITNKSLKKNVLIEANKLNVILIDRNTLKQIIQNNSLLLEYLK